tara:strand:- start:19609 stop:20352 length:744 start_codon:yes stop_codon:yes gene_type:complete
MLTTILNDYSVVIFVICICSLIQSLFGVGILLFGTPTFLFLGFSFEEALGFTLPASLSISILQIFSNHTLIMDRTISVLIVIPSLSLGLLFLFLTNQSDITQLFIGLILIFVALTRLSTNLSSYVTSVIKSYQKITLGFTGFVHGFTNLGGGLLTFYSATRYADKKIITSNIAFIYAIFAVIQITYLIFFSRFNFSPLSLVLPFISSLIFIFSGNHLIENIKNKDYSKIITLIIFAYGILSLVGFFK